MPRPRRSDRFPRSSREASTRPGNAAHWMRIVAGDLRGQRVLYSGDPQIRPMKDRTRESVFNLLGGDLTGTLAIDLFSGTGVLGLEAISRGATKAVMLDLSRTAVSLIIENANRLKLANRVEVHNADTLRWFKYLETTTAPWMEQPWVVFCCPPYAMWVQEGERLKSGLLELFRLSPPGSLFVVETEVSYDLAAAIPELEWDIRTYKPAFVGIAEKPLATVATTE
jgi:16S rRNA (guanine966-N2)-methyltransferase